MDRLHKKKTSYKKKTLYEKKRLSISKIKSDQIVNSVSNQIDQPDINFSNEVVPYSLKYLKKYAHCYFIKEKIANEARIDDLHMDVLLDIVKYLDIQDIYFLALTCKSLYFLMMSNYVLKHFKSKLINSIMNIRFYEDKLDTLSNILDNKDNISVDKLRNAIKENFQFCLINKSISNNEMYEHNKCKGAIWLMSAMPVEHTKILSYGTLSRKFPDLYPISIISNSKFRDFILVMFLLRDKNENIFSIHKLITNLYKKYQLIFKMLVDKNPVTVLNARITRNSDV